MKPIKIIVTARSAKLPQELCADFLDTDRWSEFTGYFILPGIKRASFDVKTPEVVGSRIRVHNTDGSTHVEEIIVWEAPNRIAVKFQEFPPPLRSLAAYFIESWDFRRSTSDTVITRSMVLHPKSHLARMALVPIALLMKRALEKQLRHM